MTDCIWELFESSGLENTYICLVCQHEVTTFGSSTPDNQPCHTGPAEFMDTDGYGYQ